MLYQTEYKYYYTRAAIPYIDLRSYPNEKSREKKLQYNVTTFGHGARVNTWKRGEMRKRWFGRVNLTSSPRYGNENRDKSKKIIHPNPHLIYKGLSSWEFHMSFKALP